VRIGLFISCFIDAFFPEVGVATLEPFGALSAMKLIAIA
jgi:hypothetical protein